MHPVDIGLRMGGRCGRAPRLAADATMHWTALSGALGKQLPMAALSFGA